MQSSVQNSDYEDSITAKETTSRSTFSLCSVLCSVRYVCFSRGAILKIKLLPCGGSGIPYISGILDISGRTTPGGYISPGPWGVRPVSLMKHENEISK